MSAAVIVLVLIGAIIIAGLYFLFWPSYRRRLIVGRAFPAEYLQLLRQALPIYQKMDVALQQQLQDLIKLFLHHKRFVGCGGLVITDEIRISIAAQACLLLLNRPTFEYADLHYIYVYPSAFRATREVRDELGLVSTQSSDLLGESWSNGKVVLAWDDVEKGARNFTDGYNVVLHEFAHQLDHESGVTNGAPLLYTKASYKSWAYVLGCEFEKLQQSDPSKPSIIDHYGATNPAEFFAVATETFFEEPHLMYEHHRELFEQLHDYYRLDPRNWT